MGRGFDIPLVGVKMLWVGVRYIVDRWLDIPWVGTKNTMDRGVNIP